jgi:glycosyltransferase involved in cell wall biosynthesis
LLGRVDEPVRLLWALDIFAFPSLHEGLGIALLEAMACGLAVVASRTGGITDAVEDGRTGMLVAPASSSELGAAIARLAAESRTRETLGESARRRVLERFSISAMARETLALYRVCLGRGAAAAAGRT